MDSLLKDLRYGVRVLIRNPLFTAVAVVTLALGIGANSLIFSVVDAVLLRPFPFDDPDRLFMIYEGDAARDNLSDVAPANFLDVRAQNEVFDSVSAYRENSYNLTGGDSPERVQGTVATPNFFSLLGVKPLLGRTFFPQEENRAGAPNVVLGYSLWQRRFAGDPGAIGQTMAVDGETLTVVGVMSPWFDFPLDSQFWIPPRHLVPEHPVNPAADVTDRRDMHYFSCIARLKTGISPAKAEANLDLIARRIRERLRMPVDSNSGRAASLVSLRDDLVGDIRPTLLMMLGAVGFVLLIACANVANLLIARGAARHKEIAIRGALGARGLRITRMLLTESLLLSLLGGGLGLLLALWGMGPLVKLSTRSIDGLKSVRVDGQVLFFTAAVSLITGLAFGLIPALYASKADLNESLKEGGRASGAGRSTGLARNVLVIAEVALSLILLIGAGLMINSFIRLQKVSPGFNTDGLVEAPLSLPAYKYTELRQQSDVFRRVIENMKSMPGIQSVAVISRLPLIPGNSSRGLVLESQADSAGSPSADFRVASPGYFKTMEIPILEGREFSDQDTFDAPSVAVINAALARRYWVGESPIGKHLRISGDNDSMEIVGVVANVKHSGLHSASNPEFYVSYAKNRWPSMTVVARTTLDASTIATEMKDAIWAVDKDLPVPSVTTMNEVLSRSLAGRRFSLVLLGLFAGVALVLAAVGLYGVMSYSATQRRHEIGVRMALGAEPRAILRLVLGQAALLTGMGLAIGLVLAMALTRVLSSLLFGVGPTDPATFSAICAVLAGVALLAAYIPARRAMRVGPMDALRCE